MRIAVIACQTLRDELRLALKETGVNYPVFYIEAGLHSKPESLRKRIQQELDMIDNVDTILMVFGYCGNSLMGVKSSCFQIVIPRVDDCIPLLLGSAKARKEISQGMGTYFITKGWLDYEQNIIWEYERCVARYGEQRALRLMKSMLAHYQRFMVIDTGAYPVDSVMPRTSTFAQKVGMKHEIAQGSLRLINKLLLGQWDEEFIVLKPGEELTMDDICASDSIQAATSQLLTGLSK